MSFFGVHFYVAFLSSKSGFCSRLSATVMRPRKRFEVFAFIHVLDQYPNKRRAISGTFGFARCSDCLSHRRMVCSGLKIRRELATSQNRT